MYSKLHITLTSLNFIIHIYKIVEFRYVSVWKVEGEQQMEIMVYHWKMWYKEDRILLVLSYDSANF